VQISKYIETNNLFYKNGVVGVLAFYLSNIVTGRAFIVSLKFDLGYFVCYNSLMKSKRFQGLVRYLLNSNIVRKGINMEQQTVIGSNFVTLQTALDEARNAIVKNGVKTGELIKDYSVAMDNAFDITLANGELVKWFNLTGKQKSGVKAEYSKFESALEEAKLESNKYVYWQRVKEASGYVTNGNKVKGSGSVDDKNLSDLRTIINRIVEAKNGGIECKSADLIEDFRFCFTSLGGDLTAKGMK
jgi:hypothetical protein